MSASFLGGLFLGAVIGLAVGVGIAGVMLYLQYKAHPHDDEPDIHP